MVERVFQMVYTVKPLYNELLVVKNGMQGIIGHYSSV